MSSEGSILYQNPIDTIFLLDIPISIAEAQEFPDDALQPKLLSCAPIASPYASTEPRSEKARQMLEKHQRDVAHDAEISRLLNEALQAVREALGADASYCRGRASATAWNSEGMQIIGSPRRKRRRPSGIGEQRDQTSGLAEIHSGTTDLVKDNSSEALRELATDRSVTWTQRIRPPFHDFWQAAQAAMPRSDAFMDHESIEEWKRQYFNKNDTACILDVWPESDIYSHFQFHAPPGSAFVLGKCEETSFFNSFSRSFVLRGRFDLIMLDPPWPNRSASRKFSYDTSRDQHSLKQLLLGMDLDMHIAEEGFMAVWITNKPAARELILGIDGLFQTWNVSLVEEWIWLKVTAGGEPVTQLDGMWRKPYEILLIGKAPPDRLSRAAVAESVVRRVILAVPDLHSRKPCLKQLIELTLLKDRKNSRGLEIFARHLVAGWMSWGDEVLKYNWRRCWS